MKNSAVPLALAVVAFGIGAVGQEQQWKINKKLEAFTESAIYFLASGQFISRDATELIEKLHPEAINREVPLKIDVRELDLAEDGDIFDTELDSGYKELTLSLYTSKLLL